MADSDNDAQVSIGAKIDEALAGIAKLKEQLGSINSVVTGLQDNFSKLGKTILGALGIGLSLAGINSFIRGMADAGLSSEQLTAQLGVSGAKLAEMKGIAKLTGVDMDTLAIGLNRLSLNVQSATKDSFSPQAQALKVLGLSTKDLLNLPADQYFGKLQEAVSKFNPSMNLTNALTAIGGRSMLAMLPALLMGKEAFDKWGAALKEARVGVEGFAPKAADTHARLVVLDASIDGLAKRIFLALKPAIDLIIGGLSKFFQSLDVKTIKEFAATMTDVLANAIIWMITLFSTLGDNIDAVLSRMKRAFLGAALGGFLGLFGGGVGVAVGAMSGAAIVGIFDAFIASFDKGSDKAADDVDSNKAKLVAKVIAMRDAIKEAMAGAATPDKGGGGKSDAGQMALDSRQQVEATAARLTGEIALIKGALAQKFVLYQRDSDMWMLTEQEKLRLTRDSTASAWGEEATKLQKIRDLWPAHTKEWEEANRRMLQATQSFATEMIKINADMARDMKAKMDEVSGAFQSSFNSQLRGLLAGTTSWLQAFKSITGDMVIFMIQAVEKMVANWITGKLAMLATSATTESAEVAVKTAGEAAKTGATIAGVAARTGAEEVGFAASIGMYISDAMAYIGAQVAKVFAAMTAFLAPVFGPYAPAAALAIAAGVGVAAYGMIQGFDVGTDRVLRSGLAMIHKNEQIVPAQGSGPYTGANGGAGGGSPVTIIAWDGDSVDRWLKRGGRDVLAKHVSAAMNDNPSLRPSF